MSSADLALAQTRDCADRALAVLDQAKAITVTDQDSFARAASIRAEVLKPMLAQIEATFRPITRAQDAAKKATLDQRAKIEAPIAGEDARLKAESERWYMEQERARQRAEQEAREAQERAQAEAELARDLAAEELAADGDTETAAALLAMPVEAPPVLAPVLPAAPKADGASFRKTWDFRITDESKIPRKFLIIDEKKIAQLVRAMGPEAREHVPGIEIFEKATLAQRVR